MIDYIKLSLTNINITRLIQLHELNFRGTISKTTAEINEDVLVSKYLFCEIIIHTIKEADYPDKIHVIFKGSIHKMWNELNGIKAPNYIENKVYKGYNGNQFAINNILEIRRHLEILFDCDSNQMTFQNVEFGINTTQEFEPRFYLKGLLYHKNVLFEYRHNGNYAQAKHQRWIFKLYNKSLQYNMNNFVLRIELKITKMEELKDFEIKTLKDIDNHTLHKAQLLLLRRFDELMHYDYTINKTMLSKAKLDSLKNYSNPRFWIEDLKSIHRDRHKTRLKKITEDYSEKTHQQIKKELIEKCVMINHIVATYKKENCVIINYSNIELRTTQIPIENQLLKNVICKITGFDISMQKDNSLLLSHTGLQHYYKTNKMLFEQVKRKYLSEKWVYYDLKTQITRIAHNIRNTRSNGNIKQKKLYTTQQVNLLSGLNL